MLLAFLAAVLAVAGTYSILLDLFLRDRSRVSKRVDEEFRKRQRERAERSSLFKKLDLPATGIPSVEQEKPSLRQRLNVLLEQSGLDWTLQRLVVLMVVFGLAVGAAAGLVLQSVLLAVLCAPVGAAVPLLYVVSRRKLRLDKMMSQLPDAFDLMARVIRAGQTTSQGIQAVADEFDAPLAGEFSYCFEQQNLGLPPEIALRDLARRTGLLEVRIFVLALVVQQQTGGNLAELLEKLATVIRDRARIRGKIKALTAEGRMQALVLLALPPVLLLVILVLNRAYGQVLFEHQLLLCKGDLLFIMFAFEALGALWIRRIVNFDF
jgi:tight adherence protein B